MPIDAVGRQRFPQLCRHHVFPFGFHCCVDGVYAFWGVSSHNKVLRIYSAPAGFCDACLTVFGGNYWAVFEDLAVAAIYGGRQTAYILERVELSLFQNRSNLGNLGYREFWRYAVGHI